MSNAAHRRGFSGGALEASDRLEASGAKDHQREEVFAAIAAWPSCTSAELARWTGLDFHAIARRLPELFKEQRVTRYKGTPCDVTKVRCWRWVAVQEKSEEPAA